VAPGSIFAHEYAHQIQYERGYLEDLPEEATEPELSRYAELMADAYSAYYMTHIGGAQANPQRVLDFLQVFFQIGDCAFGNAGHHGTPNQRLAAATYGFRLASEDLRLYGGRIRSTEAFHDRFVQKYPELIAPDAPVATTH
jgi:predicted metalloprotease